MSLSDKERLKIEEKLLKLINKGTRRFFDLVCACGGYTHRNDRVIDRRLQSMRKRGMIVYKHRKDGEPGWYLSVMGKAVLSKDELERGPKLKPFSREDLLNICQRASVPHQKWYDRDSADAQRQVGECLMLLRAGCKFTIMKDKKDSLCTNERTIWVKVFFPGFATFEGGNMCNDTFYLPTRKRLEEANGGDWY